MSFFKKLTAKKPTDISQNDKKFYQITCLCGAAVSFVTFVLLLVFLAGNPDPSYLWANLGFGLGLTGFFLLAFFRYMMPENNLLRRISDAWVHLTLVAAYAPVLLYILRLALYENGEILTAWLCFAFLAFFALALTVLSLCFESKFRLFSSVLYLLLCFVPAFAFPGLINIYSFAPALPVVLLSLAVLCFAAAPVIFWCFDSQRWQMKVYYLLNASATLLVSVTILLWVFLGR